MGCYGTSYGTMYGSLVWFAWAMYGTLYGHQWWHCMVLSYGLQWCSFIRMVMNGVRCSLINESHHFSSSFFESSAISLVSSIFTATLTSASSPLLFLVLSAYVRRRGRLRNQVLELIEVSDGPTAPSFFLCTDEELPFRLANLVACETWRWYRRYTQSCI
jgi:hypothetical protein